MNVADNTPFVRVWHKMPPMKALHETFGVYGGSWSKQMDRYWESNDGYTVSSRLIRTAIGTVEHVAISKLTPERGDIPWAVKQQIKNELFGSNAVAIEVFPAEKNLIDVCDIYHLWVMPKHYAMPFGIHPRRDPSCPAIERGYDFDIAKCQEWNNSQERMNLAYGQRNIAGDEVW